MKALWVVLLIVACAAAAGAQGYVENNFAPYSKTFYGTATFKADSHYVHNGSGKWATVTANIDSVAGTTVAYLCIGNDSTNAIRLNPGTSSAYGLPRTFRVRGASFYRVKGAVPVTVTWE